MKTSRPYQYNNTAAKISDEDFERSLKRNKYAKEKLKWDKKLKASGFVDIENAKGELKKQERRTKAWLDRDNILEFFLRLDSYLTNTKHIDSIHRQCLEMYTKGYKIAEICKSVSRCRRTVGEILRMYRTRIKDGYWSDKDYKKIYSDRLR